MSTRLRVVSASTYTRYLRLGVTDCARLLVGNSLYCPRGEYNLCVTDGSAAAKYHMLLEAGWQRSVWITED